MNDSARTFAAKPAVRGEEPLSIGIVGPPGGGKTLSSLRLAKGIQSVRGGDIILIDTEGGRSRKYGDVVRFKIIEFPPPCRSEDFLTAIKQQVALNPAAIIVDSLSDEHEGEGGYLEWHDELVPKMGGNDWAAWAKPKASRKRLINGLLHIKVPLIFTFRAREKTKQDKSGSKTVVVNIGWQPVAPLEIVHALDLTCILPPRADGVPVWKSDKIGEDFIIKLPNYLKPYIQDGKALCEEMGKGFAEWAKGDAGDPPPEADTDQLTADDAVLAAAAEQGMAALEASWKEIPNERRRVLQAALTRRHKPRAAEVDRGTS
jgi:AAA domain